MEAGNGIFSLFGEPAGSIPQFDYRVKADTLADGVPIVEECLKCFKHKRFYFVLATS
jgi:hypothetical protein